MSRAGTDQLAHGIFNVDIGHAVGFGADIGEQVAWLLEEWAGAEEKAAAEDAAAHIRQDLCADALDEMRADTWGAGMQLPVQLTDAH